MVLEDDNDEEDINQTALCTCTTVYTVIFYVDVAVQFYPCFNFNFLLFCSMLIYMYSTIMNIIQRKIQN